MIKKRLALATSVMILTACSNAQPQAEMPTVGGETDAHGCLPSAGQSYSYLKKACLQVFDVADIKLDDPANKPKRFAVFFREINNRLKCLRLICQKIRFLDVVKGGYISKDGKVRLMKTKTSWKISK